MVRIFWNNAVLGISGESGRMSFDDAEEWLPTYQGAFPERDGWEVQVLPEQ